MITNFGKTIKHAFLACMTAAPLLFSACSAPQQKGAERDKEMDRFVTDLLQKMTLEEKLGQLNLPVAGDIVTGGSALQSDIVTPIREGKVGAMFNLKGAERIAELQRIAVEESRLGIPIIFCMDIIHGYETIFPIPLGLACSWDMEGIRQSAQVAATEATADGIQLTFSPMVDICHDARWGRISEGSGEDPYLGSRIAEAMVRGYQGDDLANDHTIMACMKHFAGYGAPLGGRDYNTVDLGRYHLFNEYMQPYKACVDAGVGSVMASFNSLDGMPSTCNPYLLTEVLRNQWGFTGFTMSDYNAVQELMSHCATGDLMTSAILSLKAGLDMDMVSEGLPNLKEAVEKGQVKEAEIDQACRRILEAKYKLGLFDDPYRYCDPERRPREILSAEHRAFARKMATESMVLLKNDNHILPLEKKGTIALIGPLADARTNMAGTWSVAAVHDRYKTVKEGIEDALDGRATLLYAKGCNLMYNDSAEAIATLFGHEIRDSRSVETMRAEAIAAARRADVILLAMGEASEMSGECASRVNIEMPDAQHDLMVELKKLGKPMILLHFAGRPTVLNWETENLDAILETWFSGSETGDAIADIVFGEVSPSGHLSAALPRHVGQLPMSYRQFNTSRPMWGEYDGFVKYNSCYSDVKKSPLYPFGYGLTYTTFEYSNFALSDTAVALADLDKGELTASVTVTNTGSYAADEVVQLYIRDMVCLPVRPIIELRGFERIHLEPGESKQVTFPINSETLGFYRTETEWVVEPGTFRIMVGTNSRDLQRLSLEIL